MAHKEAKFDGPLMTCGTASKCALSSSRLPVCVQEEALTRKRISNSIQREN